MKKTVRANIGGIAFNVEEDAFTTLKEYFESIKQHLGESPETDEIIRDIEERSAELFTELLASKEIITEEMVIQVIETLGKPEQIASEDSEKQSENTYSKPSFDKRRRLYRDGENSIIAGVCSGLGLYFNIDPLAFRLILAVLFFAHGLGLIIYLVLWVAVPRAITTRQRMEMRGEEVNFSNLEKNIKHEFEEVKKSMQKHRVSDLFERIFSALGGIFIAIGRVLGAIISVLAVIFAILFISIGLIGLLGVAISLFLGEYIVSHFPSISGFTANEILSTTIDLGSMLWVTIPVFAIIAIPLIALVYLGLRMVFRFRRGDTLFFVTSATLWISAVVFLALVMFFQARSFSILESVKERIELSENCNGIKSLVVSVSKNADDFDIQFEPDKIIRVDEYSLAYTDGVATIYGKPKVYFEKSEGDCFELLIVKKSRGATKNQAKSSAEAIDVIFSSSDTTLTLYPYYALHKKSKWRTQEVEITICIPEGKEIFIDESLENLIGIDKDFAYRWPDEMVGKTWIMHGTKLEEK